MSQHYLLWLVNSTATLKILDVCRLLNVIFKRQSRRSVFHGTNDYLLFGKQVLGLLPGRFYLETSQSGDDLFAYSILNFSVNLTSVVHLQRQNIDMRL